MATKYEKFLANRKRLLRLVQISKWNAQQRRRARHWLNEGYSESQKAMVKELSSVGI